MGGVCDKDVSIQLLTYFLDDDDAELAHIRNEYASGRLLSGHLKARTIQLIQERVHTHQQARERVTPEVVAQCMTSKVFFSL